MKDTGYINIQGWMINKLPIRGNELMLFALIYGFSQDGQTKYKGSINYIQSALKFKSRTTPINLIGNLIEKELVVKEKIGNVNHYHYNEDKVNEYITSTKNVLPDKSGTKNVLLSSTKNVPFTSTKNVPNNNNSNYKDNNKEKDFFANAEIKNLQGEPTTIKKHIGTPQYRLLNEACVKVETYQLFRSMWLDGRCQILCDLLEYKRDIKKPYKKARGLTSTIKMFTTFEPDELKRAYEAMVTNEWNTMHPKRLKESKVIPMQQDPKFKFLTK